MSDFEMDIDVDSDEETETQMKELQQLHAVLQSDEQESVVTHSEGTTQESCPSITSGSISSQLSDELSKIEMALALNKFTDDKLQRLEILLNARLQECKRRLKALHDSDFVGPIEKQTQFRYVLCGKPYFKDKNLYPAPHNEDTILMMKSEMYDFNSIPSVPGWTVKDKSEFLKFITKMSQNIRVKELNSEISHLRRQAGTKKQKNIDEEIQKLRKQIETVNSKSLKDLALPVDQEYDWETVSNKLNQRHSAHEYRALWKLFLHPSVNKSSWSKSEHVVLQKLAYSNDYQDWDKIAKDLNTGRTGYQCFVYFRTNMNDTSSGLKWTKEEEEFLKRLVDFYREDNYIPWGKVAASMENRTKIQIYNKYLRLEEQRKGRFIPEEDAVILTCIDNFGAGNNFRKIQKYLPGRSIVQLRNRYQVLCKNRVSTVWSIEEDKKLIQLMANQDNSLASYANISEHLPGKDRSQIRARHKTLLKWMKKFPNTDIALAPRRGSRRLGHGRAMSDLNNALEDLKKRIQNEVQEKKKKTITEASSEQEIDDAIVATIRTEDMKMERYGMPETSCVLDVEGEECEYPTSEGDNKTNLQKLLMLLRCKLNKARFVNSDDYQRYFNLDHVKRNYPTSKVRCYSRKNMKTIKTIHSESCPDLWGNNKLGNLDYVLPPHLATITGCRKIMAYVKDHADQSLNLYMRNNNKRFKEELTTLMERFNLLFVWPLLLSNESPDQYIEQMMQPHPPKPQEPDIDLPNIRCIRTSSKPLVVPAITIPHAKEPCSESTVIDLPADEANKEEVTMNSNFAVEFNENESAVVDYITTTIPHVKKPCSESTVIACLPADKAIIEDVIMIS